MPIFEYICGTCSNRFTVLVGMVAGSSAPECPQCGGRELSKLISRFSVIRPNGGSLDDIACLADPSDPASMDQLVGGVKDEFGDEAGEDFAEMLDECDAGVKP